MRPYNLVLLAGEHQLDKSDGLPLCLRTVDISAGQLHDANLFVLLFGLVRSQADTGCFGVGEGTPGDNTVIYFLLSDWDERVAHGHACLVYRHVGEEVAADHVTYCKNIGGGSLKIIIYLDSLVIVFDTRSFEIQSFDVWLATKS